MKRKLKKSLWNVWIFDSHPINKRTVFSLLSFLFGEKKKWQWIWETEISMFIFVFLYFFSKRANVIWLLNMKPVILLPLSLFLLHLPFVIPSLFFFWFVFVPHPFSLFAARSLTQDPVEKAASILHVFFCNLFCIYFCLHSWRQDGSRLVWQAPSICPPANFVWFLSFSIWSFSQYLPVLSKCYCKVFQWDDSKYVYINRGNTLGYILLNPRVALSLSGLLVFLSTEVLSNEATECLLIILEVFYESKWKSRILFYAWKRLILVLWTGEFLPGAVSDFLTGREHGRAACEAKPRGFGAPPLSSEITTPQPCECWVNWQARENHL